MHRSCLGGFERHWRHGFLQLMSSSDSQAINFLLGGDAPWFGESLGVNSAIVVPRCCWINIKFMFSLIQVYHWYPFLVSLFGSPTWSFHRNIWSNFWDVRLGSLSFGGHFFSRPLSTGNVGQPTGKPYKWGPWDPRTLFPIVTWATPIMYCTHMYVPV